MLASGLQVGKLEGAYQILNGVCAYPAEEQAFLLQQHIEQEFASCSPSPACGAARTGADGPAGAVSSSVSGGGVASVQVQAGALPFDVEIGKMTSLRVRVPGCFQYRSHTLLGRPHQSKPLRCTEAKHT